ncbi:MAG: AmmeMemoRadiSam system protein A [Armatimonadota bacterium]|nr:AmmeMemoRadiSam system protein A [Armatimonadota bacterium]
MVEMANQTAQEELDEQQQQMLLDLARETIERYVTEDVLPDLPADDPALEQPRAVFVTLHKHGQLRGCIGSLEPREPLAAAVQSSAVSAATQDPRFPPVTPQELDELEIEISVLSPLRKVDSADEIVVGKHGVMVADGARRGVFLPQVAPEQGWDRDTMLQYLCAHKAGLPADAWRRGAELHVFTCQVFSEGD